jgi:hypothetical protein
MLSDNFKAKAPKPSTLGNPKKQRSSRNQQDKKELQTSNIEKALQQATYPMSKQMVADFFESDMEKLASLDLADLIDEIDDIIYHGTTELVEELKRTHLKKGGATVR